MEETATPESISTYENVTKDVIDNLEPSALVDELVNNDSEFGLSCPDGYDGESYTIYDGSGNVAIMIMTYDETEIASITVLDNVDIAKYVAKTLGMEKVNTYIISEDGMTATLEKQNVTYDEYLNSLSDYDMNDGASAYIANYNDITAMYGESDSFNMYMFGDVNIEDFLE